MEKLSAVGVAKAIPKRFASNTQQEIAWQICGEQSLLNHTLTSLHQRSNLASLLSCVCREVGFTPPRRSTNAEKAEALLLHVGWTAEAAAEMKQRILEAEQSRKKQDKAKAENAESGEVVAEAEDGADEAEVVHDDAENENYTKLAEEEGSCDEEAPIATDGQASSKSCAADSMPQPRVDLPRPAQQDDVQVPEGCHLQVRLGTVTTSPSWCVKLPPQAAFRLKASFSRAFKADTVGLSEATSSDANRLGRLATLSSQEAKRQCVAWAREWASLTPEDKKIEFETYTALRGGVSSVGVPGPRQDGVRCAPPSSQPEQHRTDPGTASAAASASTASSSAPAAKKRKQ